MALDHEKIPNVKIRVFFVSYTLLLRTCYQQLLQLHERKVERLADICKHSDFVKELENHPSLTFATMTLSYYIYHKPEEISHETVERLQMLLKPITNILEKEQAERLTSELKWLTQPVESIFDESVLSDEDKAKHREHLITLATGLNLSDRDSKNPLIEAFLKSQKKTSNIANIQKAILHINIRTNQFLHQQYNPNLCIVYLVTETSSSSGVHYQRAAEHFENKLASMQNMELFKIFLCYVLLLKLFYKAELTGKSESKQQSILLNKFTKIAEKMYIINGILHQHSNPKLILKKEINLFKEYIQTLFKPSRGSKKISQIFNQAVKANIQIVSFDLPKDASDIAQPLYFNEASKTNRKLQTKHEQWLMNLIKNDTDFIKQLQGKKSEPTIPEEFEEETLSPTPIGPKR